MKIQDVTGAAGVGDLAPAVKIDGGAKGAAFGDVLKQSMSEVNRLQEKADASITALASGEKTSLHDTMIAMEQASISFKLMMQVRNKIVEAYQEMMRIQV